MKYNFKELKEGCLSNKAFSDSKTPPNMENKKEHRNYLTFCNKYQLGIP